MPRLILSDDQYERISPFLPGKASDPGRTALQDGLCHRISQKNGDQSIGRSRGGLTTKIHALVDGLGMLARFSLTGGQASDTGEALPLFGALKPLSLAAAKAYDTNANRLEQRTPDKHLYASRNLSERFFYRIKQFRRLATRYDKLSERFASFVALTAAFIWLFSLSIGPSDFRCCKIAFVS